MTDVLLRVTHLVFDLGMVPLLLFSDREGNMPFWLKEMNVIIINIPNVFSIPLLNINNLQQSQ